MQITWDRFAVPTIQGVDDLDVVRGIGYAQAVAVGNKVLELYGVARGTSAEHWGSSFVLEDVLTARLGLQAKTDEWLAAQLPETLERVDAFCRGFNEACAEDERRGGDRRQVLPVAPRDVIAHVLRLFVRFNQKDPEQLAFSPADATGMVTAGSNSWAVAGSRSTTGCAMVMINPHLSWTRALHRFVELRTVSPSRDFHGCTLIGVPWQIMGYSHHIAWAHTVNPIRNLVAYELDVAGGSYPHGDEVLDLETVDHVIRVRDGEPIVVTERRSLHGPVVVAPDGADVAVRIAGVLDQPAYHALESWWQLSRARSVEELFHIHDRLWLPMFNLVAGDASGSIGALFGGTPPVRQTWAQAKQRLRGDDPAARALHVHPASAMPRVVDPDCGWVNNCNETPFLFTSPPLDESAYPPAIAPSARELVDFRPVASRDWLSRHASISPEQLLELKFSKRAVLAEQLLDDLLDAAAGQEDLAEAVAVLAAWDRTMGATSKGYLLCYLWAALATPPLVVPGRFHERTDEPGQLPTRLADPHACVALLREAVALMGRLGIGLDAALEDLLTIGPDGLPPDGASGVLGGMKSLEVQPGPAGVQVVLGDTWVSRVQLRPGAPPLAESLLVYGNTCDPAAPPADDQYALWIADRLRPPEPVPPRSGAS